MCLVSLPPCFWSPFQGAGVPMGVRALHPHSRGICNNENGFLSLSDKKKKNPQQSSFGQGVVVVGGIERNQNPMGWPYAYFRYLVFPEGRKAP